MNWIGVRYTLVLGAIIGLKAYADFTDLSQERVLVAGSTLSLANESGQCALSLEGAPPLVLAIKWPCAFSPDRTGKPRVERVENTPIVIARHSPPKPVPSRDCDSEQQAIQLIDGRLEASTNRLGRPKVFGSSPAERNTILNKTGIIFFKDFYYQPGDSEDRPSGDHIDLWSRGTTATINGDYFYRAKAVWFWELK